MHESIQGIESKANEERWIRLNGHVRWLRWWIGGQNWKLAASDSLLAVVGITLVNSAIAVLHLYPRFPSIVLLYFLLIILLAGMRGSFAAILAALFASFTFHFFFTPQPYQFSFPEQPTDELLDPWVFLAAGICAGQLTAVLRRRAERAKRKEQATRLLSEQARELSILQERQRLARELHDSVSQTLYGINLGARAALEALESEPGEAVAPMQYVVALTEASLAEMRVLIFELRPESLATDGIVASLNRQLAVLRTRNKLLVEAEFCEEPVLPLEAKYALYRIAQEALHNIVKHASATTVNLRLQQFNGDLVFGVCDDGKGFDPSGSFPGHLGLRSIQERTAQLGGSCTIESAPAYGTCLWVCIPSDVDSKLTTKQTTERALQNDDLLLPPFE